MRKQYIIADPDKPDAAKGVEARFDLSRAKKVNAIWKKDYETKTGIVIRKPQAQGLSRNHRISDHDIKENIIDDINHHFEKNRIQQLIQLFPWATDGIDKTKATALLKNLKIEQNFARKIKLANELYRLMSNHVANISYGNAKQNCAIGKCLDLNAPKNEAEKHSLTARSRGILEQCTQSSNVVLFTSPKTDERRRVIFSSHYARGGEAHKEDGNIVVDCTSPRTKKLITDFFDVRKNHVTRSVEPGLLEKSIYSGFYIVSFFAAQMNTLYEAVCARVKS